MSKRKSSARRLVEGAIDEEVALFLEPASTFDKCIVGVAKRATGPTVVAYNAEKCVEALAEDMGLAEAMDWFEVNTAGAFVGEGTPVFFESLEELKARAARG